jgi:hypothetical protein
MQPTPVINLDFISPIDTDDYVQNSIWKLANKDQSIVQTNSRLMRFPGISSDDAYFNLTLQRMPLYYMINCLYPCLILNAVILAVFFVPFNMQIGLGNSVSNRKFSLN